jgi:hypothetical protein
VIISIIRSRNAYNFRPFYLASCGCRAASLVALQNSINVIVYEATESSTVVVIGVTLSEVNLSAHQQPSKDRDQWSLGGSLPVGREVLAES